MSFASEHAQHSIGLRQLALIKYAKLDMHVPPNGMDMAPSANGLSNLINSVTCDPLDLGEARRIPTRILAPLWNMGITNYNDLIDPTCVQTTNGP